jgi:hypothetical protein
MIWKKISNWLSLNKTQDTNRFSVDNKNKVKKNLNQNIDYINDRLVNSDDLIFRKFFIGGDENITATIVYLSSLVEAEYLQQEVLKPLMLQINSNKEKRSIDKQIDQLISNFSIPLGEIKVSTNIDKCIESILSGSGILFINQQTKAYILNIKSWTGRAIEKPNIEATTRGPQEAFNESLATNISLVRKRLKDNNLMIKTKKIGARTRTDTALIYINDIVDKSLLEEVEEHLEYIDIDGILDIGQLNQLIDENWISIFPQFQTTERPDKIVANLLEGRVIVMVDGTPFTAIIPTTFAQFLQTPEDYYDSFYIATFLRILRYMSAFITITLPSIYVSLVSFHHELIPRGLAITIAELRKEVPFPSYLEALIMEISVELLREAGIRLPGPIGQTIGIVGGLILGQAAVDAGLVSSPMVIVVGLTAIASFALPSYTISVPLRLLRFPMMLFASVFSIYGIMIGLLLILIHLSSLESFGQPYFAPFAPIKWQDLKDSIIRLPLNLLSSRPITVPSQQKDRKDREGGEDIDED